MRRIILMSVSGQVVTRQRLAPPHDRRERLAVQVDMPLGAASPGQVDAIHMTLWNAVPAM